MPCLELFAASRYQPPVRSPLALAILKGQSFGDFQLDAEVRQTSREYAHRDLCLVFGYQAPDRYYYAHLASTKDANAHDVFLVDGAARRPIATRTTAGVEWGQGWHHVRVSRDLASGRIAVYFDDLDTPVLEAADTTLSWGRIGFGSFDDTGCLRALEVRGLASRLEDPGASLFEIRRE